MLRAPALALMILAGTVALAESVWADTKFNPSFEVRTTADPEAPAQLGIEFVLEGDLQSAAIVFYVPRDWGVVRGEDIPVGTKVGTISSLETLGLINSACNTPIPVDYELLNATVDATRSVSFDDLDEVPPSDDYNVGGASPDEEWLGDVGGEPRPPPYDGFGIPDFAEDKDANGLLDGVDHYPDFLVTAFGGIRPLARLAAVTPVAGVPILIQLLIFPPASRLDFPNPSLTQSLAGSPDSGYPVVLLWQDFGNLDKADQPTPITDHCTPRQLTLEIYAPDGGSLLLVNPQSGTYAFKMVAVSMPDADQDRIQNNLDTCHLTGNAGSPLIPNDGDIDGDGLDASCDPNDDPLAGGSTSDQDEDGYLNRQDNCPFVVNGYTNWGADPVPDLYSDQSDQDFDDIGDACDPNPYLPDGGQIVATRTFEVIVGDPSGSGGRPSLQACPNCYRPEVAPVEAGVAAEGSGNQLAVAAGLIAVGVGASAVVVGGGAAYLFRRRRS